VEPLSSVFASASASASASALDPFKLEIIRILKIPVHLTGSADVSLQVAYQKYKAYLVASQALDDMLGNRTWTIKRPTRTHLIEVFVSKSFFHSHYRRYFPKVADYPKMMAWLEGKSESEDVEVWGVKKVTYTFSDLNVWLENGGKWELDNESEESEKVVKRGKGKGKGKELEKRKDKKKDKGHKKKESSKRAK
jgi:hypothetical protein